MNYDYAKIAREVIAAVGGPENIRSAAHCATRLRLIVADRAKADDEKVGEIDAVKGTFFTAGQYQIIFGTGHVNRVYEQITQLGIAETTASEAKEAKMEGKNQVQKAIRTFGDVFVPVIPALVATGLFLGLKGALLNNNFLALFGMTNADIPQSFQVLVEVLSGTTFAFLPAIVCWSTFRVFGGSPVLGLILGLMPVNGALPNAYSVADPSSGVTPLMLFGFVPIVGYQGSILPAFVAGVLGSKLEKKLRKTVPAVFDFMITPFLVLLIMLVLSLLVIGPCSMPWRTSCWLSWRGRWVCSWAWAAWSWASSGPLSPSPASTTSSTCWRSACCPAPASTPSTPSCACAASPPPASVWPSP